MKKLRIFCFAEIVAILLAALVNAQTNATPKPASTLPTDEEIRKILVDRIDVQQKSVGMVVGIITPNEKRIISYGKLSQNDSLQPNGDTIFEIGSVTKVFTALLLADMVRRGEVSLNDPVEKYLPAGVKIPERNGKKITLVDLATHTSGLPFAPSDLNAFDSASYAKYTDEQLYKFLSVYKLESDIGAKWNYSNLGIGLLGKALASRAGMSYEKLVRRRITKPLGMNSTAVTISSKMKKNLALGYNSKMQPAPAWEAPAFPGDGELKSTVNDLLTLLSAFTGDKKSSLSPAMTAMLQTRRPGPNLQQALGWWVISLGPGDEGFVTHGGQTWGYASTVAYDPKTRTGVVILSNMTGNDGGLGWHLLRPALPVETSAAAQALKARKEITINTKLFDLYIGRYQPEAGDVITIERRGDNLFFVSPTAPQGLRLYAESEQKFFIKEADLTVAFQISGEGQVSGLIVEFAGTKTLVPRLKPEKENP